MNIKTLAIQLYSGSTDHLAIWFAAQPVRIQLATQMRCLNSHSNPRQFWQWINSLKGYHCPIPPLHDSGIVFTKDSDKATLFNRYFALFLLKRIVPTFIP